MIVSAEDGTADTIRPRFDAAGGDPTRARLLGDEEPFYVPEDVPRLEWAIKQVGAFLVVIDPIMAFLSGDVNSNRDQDVRRALTPLKRIAERTGAAVVLVRHLNKTPGGNPLYRGGGSIGIIGAARSGLMVGRHPDDEELRVLAGQKNNLSLPPESLAYSIETAENGAARIVYRNVSGATAGQILCLPADEEEKSAFSEAKEFLISELSEGPVTYRQIEKAYRAAGVKERTLRRAKKELGVHSEKEADGSWTWSLPHVGTGGEFEGVQPLPGGNVGRVGNLAEGTGEKPADPSEEGQGCQVGQGDQEEVCIHNHPGGKGCYVCDPNHPYRHREGTGT